MATDNGVSSIGLTLHPLAEPLHSPSGSRKGSGEDAVTTSDSAGSPCRPSIIPVACQSSSPTCDSHGLRKHHHQVCGRWQDCVGSELHAHFINASGSFGSSLHDPEGSATATLKSPKREEGRVAVDVVDSASRPTQERPANSPVTSSLSNGFLHHAEATAVLEVERAAGPQTPYRDSIFEPLQNGKLPEQPARAGFFTRSSDAKLSSESPAVRPATTPPESPRENGKPCCNGRQEIRTLVASPAVVGSSPAARSSVASPDTVLGTAGRKHCVPNGDVGSRCVRDSAGVGGDKTVLSTPPAHPIGRRRSASDGAVQENGWARRGRSSHSECNGLDRRTIVLSSSSGSSSGSTEGPDSPLPGEVLGSGVRWSGGGRSVSEVKELAYARLQAELSRAQQELRLRDEEVARLSQIRDQVGAELEELTASLFEEANNMVREANMKQAAAEKRLQEATLKVEVLQAELSRHRHRRSPSNYELATCRPPSPPSQQVSQQQQSLSLDSRAATERAPTSWRLIRFATGSSFRWQEKPCITDREDMFVSRLYREDVLPCLHFPNCQLAAQVLRAIEENSITIEAVNAANPFPRRCSLLEASRVCQYRMRLGDSGSAWYHISQLCRNRITSVCDLFCYLRYIQQGLVRSSSQEMYWEVMRRRRSIALARLGLPPC
ncbi:hypothetical protein MRX96_035771 [Rhipicephalus microplus]